MKKDLLKKISKVLAVLLLFTMCMSKAPVAIAEDGQTKDIAVGTSYYIGDTINFGSELQYFDNGNDYGVRVQGGYKVDHTLYNEGQWLVNIMQGGGYLSLYFDNPDFTGTEIVKGVTCSGGNGSAGNPYTFELIYEPAIVASIKVINGTRSTDEGASGDHTVTDPEATVSFASGDYVTLGFLQANDGYTKLPVVTKDGKAITLNKNSNKETGGGWNVTYYEAGHFPNTYPNGWIRISGYPTVSADFVVEYLPIEYTIAFDANGGEGSMDAINTKYDVEVELPECTMTNGDLYFLEWNTKVDGSGDSYYDRETVRNMTTEDGETVTLYAQWREDPVYSYEEITEVSFTITPPKDGDTVTVDADLYLQNPQPEITLPSDAAYVNVIDGEIAAYWIKSEDPGESFEEGVFEGTYKAGDTFYAIVGLFIENSVDYAPYTSPNQAVTDETVYYFAEDLKANVTGADVVSVEVYTYGYDEATIILKGVIEKEPEPEPQPEPDPEPKPDPQPDPQPQPKPAPIPLTGVEEIPFSPISSLISLLGVCLTGLFLNKRR